MLNAANRSRFEVGYQVPDSNGSPPPTRNRSPEITPPIGAAATAVVLYRKASPRTSRATAATRIFWLLAGITTVAALRAPTSRPFNDTITQDLSLTAPKRGPTADSKAAKLRSSDSCSAARRYDSNEVLKAGNPAGRNATVSVAAGTASAAAFALPSDQRNIDHRSSPGIKARTTNTIIGPVELRRVLTGSDAPCDGHNDRGARVPRPHDPRWGSRVVPTGGRRRAQDCSGRQPPVRWRT